MPTPSEIFRQTRRIEIRTSKLVNELFGGQYHSTFKGRGMEFSDVREYIPGDDVRSIHWNVTARLGHPYIKRFTEERELTILIAVDVSGSHMFGTKRRFKSELAAELVSILSFASLKNNDKVGLLLFSDQIETYIPPRKTKSHVLRLVRDVLTYTPRHKNTNLNEALQYLNRIQKKRAVVFIISDFIDENYQKTLTLTQRHHDTIAFVLEDPMENSWPLVNRLLIEDAETGERQLIKSGNRMFHDLYSRASLQDRLTRDQIFSKANIDRVIFRTDQDYVRPLLNFFQERSRRLKR